MNAFTAAALLAIACCSASVHAADPAASDAAAKAPTAQQNKMTVCNMEAEGMKGDERKAFMSKCLSKQETQQDRMKRCNAEAQDRKGDERKAFMSSCLSSKG